MQARVLLSAGCRITVHGSKLARGPITANVSSCVLLAMAKEKFPHSSSPSIYFLLSFVLYVFIPLILA